MTPDIARALELASRNDGYLVGVGDPDIAALKATGLVVTQSVGDGWLIARALPVPRTYARNYRGGNRWLRRAAEIGAAP